MSDYGMKWQVIDVQTRRPVLPIAVTTEAEARAAAMNLSRCNPGKMYSVVPV